LFEYCIFFPVFSPEKRHSNEQLQFWLLAAASVCITASGYIINDYFDLNIDEINKPDKVIVNKIISRRWTIFWHLFLSMCGILFSAMALPLQYSHLLFANIAAVVLLFFYSTTFKKQLLIGNIIVSALSAWTIIIIFLSKFRLNEINIHNPYRNEYAKLYKLAVVYAGFAFIISLIREVIKDMEDVYGDQKYNCKTMPIVWGMNTAKVFTAVWLIVLMAAIIILQFYVLQFGWWWYAIYSFIFIIVPLGWLFKKLFDAQTQKNFHQLSLWLKLIMFTGIISMLFFKLYQ
jgi:4-hydroxybenzoate polyprenyltransferase